MGIGNDRADVKRDAHLDAGCRCRRAVVSAQGGGEVIEDTVHDRAGRHVRRYDKENFVATVFAVVVMLPVRILEQALRYLIQHYADSPAIPVITRSGTEVGNVDEHDSAILAVP
jgi:hypothetical protein